VTILQNLSDICLIRPGGVFIQLVNMGGRLGYRTFNNAILRTKNFGIAVQMVTGRNLIHIY
jgi:hypothetical protein